MKTPVLARNQVMDLLVPFQLTNKVIILGIRGYFEPQNGNKKGIYDDALFLVTPDLCKGYNANTDPSVDRPGIAILKPGVYRYRKGLHGVHHLDLNNPADEKLYDELNSTGKDLPPIAGRILPYWAFRQASNVTVTREGWGDFTDSPNARFWIDIHCGGEWTTSSEGCQTIFKPQWPDFRDVGFDAMASYQEPEIPYVLIDKPASLVVPA